MQPNTLCPPCFILHLIDCLRQLAFLPLPASTIAKRAAEQAMPHCKPIETVFLGPRAHRMARLCKSRKARKPAIAKASLYLERHVQADKILIARTFQSGVFSREIHYMTLSGAT